MKIIITTQAEKNLIDITDYLYAKFGEIVIQRFLEKINSFKIQISSHPEIGKKYYNGIYVFLLIKQINAFYRIENNKIIILTFWDNRQNPTKLIKILKTS